MGAIAEDVRKTGTLGAVNDAVSLNQPGTSVVTAQLTGTFVGTVVFEANNDEGASPNWVAIKATNVNTQSAVASATAPGIFKLDASGFRQTRVRCSAYTSGSIVVTLNGSVAASAPGLSTGGSAVTLADGADTAEGATTDAAVTGDTSGTVNAHLRGLTKAIGDPADAAVGDATGTLLGKIRQIAKLLAAKLGVTAAASDFADGSITTLGLNADAAVTGDTSGTANAHLRGLTKAIGDPADAAVGDATGTLLAKIRQVAKSLAATLTVQGAAAAGAAVAGNPVLGGMSDGTNAQPLRASANASTTTHALAVQVMYNTGGTAVSGLLSPGAIGDAAGGGQLPVFHTALYDGSSSYNRARNNVDATLLASASRTVTQGPTTLTTYNLGAIIFVLDMTIVGTGSVTLTINEVDPASGKSILLLSGAAVVTNSTNVYIIDPLLTAAANSIAKNRVTRTLSWTVTANNANSATYSLGAMELMP